MKQVLLVITIIILFTIYGFTQSRGPNTNHKAFEDLRESTLNVFPNPATDYMQITENEIVGKVNVYDLIGKKVKSFSHRSGEKYFIGDLRKGIYLIQLVDKENSILATKRISKK